MLSHSGLHEAVSRLAFRLLHAITHSHSCIKGELQSA